MYVLVHQVGKVASQTIEQAVRRSRANVRVERYHILSDRGLERLETICGLPGAKGLNKSVLEQLKRARAVRKEIATLDSILVLTGYRDPLDLAISAYFQNLKMYCPWLTYDDSRLAVETGRLIETFNASVARVVSGAPLRTFQDGVLSFKLTSEERWFDHEFNEFYGVDIYGHQIGDAAFISFSSGKHKFVVYRAEGLRQSLPPLLQVCGLTVPADWKDENVGAEKRYARLYTAFKHQFQPSSAVTDYYRGTRFFRHFYGGK